MRVMLLASVLVASAPQMGAVAAQDVVVDETEAALTLNAEARPTGGVDLEARLEHRQEGGSATQSRRAALPATGEGERLRISCRDGDDLLGESEGAAPSLRLGIDPLEATINATCMAETTANEAGIAVTRSVTIPGAPNDDDADHSWIFWVAGGTTVVAAIAIVIAMVVANASSPVNVGTPTVDGW